MHRDLEDRIVEITQTEQQMRKIFLNEESIRDFWDNIKCLKIYIIEIPEGKRARKNI